MLLTTVFSKIFSKCFFPFFPKSDCWHVCVRACVSLRTLCVVVDSLSCTDSSISAAAQRWLVRALSLNDVIRILEPILLLLLHPSTQRCSILNIKQNVTAGKHVYQQCITHVLIENSTIILNIFYLML